MSELLRPIEGSNFLDCKWLADRFMEILPELEKLDEEFYAEARLERLRARREGKF